MTYKTDIFCPHCSSRDSSPLLQKILAQVMSETCQRKGVAKPVAEPKATLVFVTGLVLLVMNFKNPLSSMEDKTYSLNKQHKR